MPSLAPWMTKVGTGDGLQARAEVSATEGADAVQRGLLAGLQPDLDHCLRIGVAHQVAPIAGGGEVLDELSQAALPVLPHALLERGVGGVVQAALRVVVALVHVRRDGAANTRPDALEAERAGGAGQRT